MLYIDLSFFTQKYNPPRVDAHISVVGVHQKTEKQVKFEKRCISQKPAARNLKAELSQKYALVAEI